VYSITKGLEPKLTAVWRARVDTTSGAFGFQVDARLEKFAMDLVGRLIGDGVLARTASGTGPANETRPAAGGGNVAVQPMTYGGGDGIARPTSSASAPPTARGWKSSSIFLSTSASADRRVRRQGFPSPSLLVLGVGEGAAGQGRVRGPAEGGQMVGAI
jgi:hypothetical protein